MQHMIKICGHLNNHTFDTCIEHIKLDLFFSYKSLFTRFLGVSVEICPFSQIAIVRLDTDVW